MTNISVKVDHPIVTELERLHYEFESYRAIIGYVLTQDMDISATVFKNYQNEFAEVNKKYMAAKDVLTNEVVKAQYPDAINWSMDFANASVNITLP